MRYAQNVVSPDVLLLLGKPRHVKFELPFVGRGFEQDLVVTARCNRHVGVEADGAGEYEAIVVIRVLANQIHASWRSEYFWMYVEFLLEDLRQFVALQSLHLRRAPPFACLCADSNVSASIPVRNPTLL